MERDEGVVAHPPVLAEKSPAAREVLHWRRSAPRMGDGGVGVAAVRKGGRGREESPGAAAADGSWSVLLLFLISLLCDRRELPVSTSEGKKPQTNCCWVRVWE